MNQPIQSRRHGPRGFTLLEIMVVLILVGILTAVIIPEMRGTAEDAWLRASSRDLINVCTLANSLAVSHGLPHRVHLDPATGKYRLERQREESGGGFIELRDVPENSGQIDSHLTVTVRTVGSAEPGPEIAPSEDGPQSTGDPSTITFYPDGTAEARIIQLQDRQGFRRFLRINPITARLTVTEVEPENSP